MTPTEPRFVSQMSLTDIAGGRQRLGKVRKHPLPETIHRSLACLLLHVVISGPASLLLSSRGITDKALFGPASPRAVPSRVVLPMSTAPQGVDAPEGGCLCTTAGSAVLWGPLSACVVDDDVCLLHGPNVSAIQPVQHLVGVVTLAHAVLCPVVRV